MPITIMHMGTGMGTGMGGKWRRRVLAIRSVITPAGGNVIHRIHDDIVNDTDTTSRTRNVPAAAVVVVAREGSPPGARKDLRQAARKGRNTHNPLPQCIRKLISIP